MHRLRFLLVLFIAGLLLTNALGVAVGALVNISAIRVAKGQPMESVAPMLGVARAVRPGDTRPRRLMGHLLYEQGDYAGATQVLSGVCESQQSDFLSMLWLGLSYDKLGRDTDALRCFSIGRSSPYLIMLGDQAAHSDKERWYRLAIQADPKSESATLALAHFYDPHQAEEARQWYLRAIELSPSNALTYVELAILLFTQLHDRQQAQYYLYRSIEVKPVQTNAYVWMGHIERDRDLGAAVEWYSRAVEANPDSAWARRYLGRTLCEMGEYEQGIQQLQEAISRDPQDAIAYLNLGKWCHLPHDSLYEAVAAFEAAIRFASDDHVKVSAYVGLGDAYARAGNIEAARQSYVEALHIEPENHSALEGLKKVSQ